MKIAYRMRFIPMIIGFIVSFLSFANVGAASIPYQDATPELYQKYLNEVATAKLWMVIGVVLLFAGIVYYFLIKGIYRKGSTTNQD